MDKRKQIWILVAWVVLQVSGCAITGKGLDPGPAGATRLGAERSDGVASDYPVDLAQLIHLSVHGDRSISENIQNPGHADSSTDSQTKSVGLEESRKYFYDNCSTNERCGILRDRVQDRLIWASESACADYLSGVRKSFTRTNLNLGGATTLFGALGSVLTSVDATRTFSGAAAVTSGLRAEYNDVYFSSQAFELLSKAIRSVREKTLKSIYDGRLNKDFRAYTLDGAIGDAMRYHATCNVMAGLEEAADAVTRERDPGLKRLSELLQGVGAGLNLSIGTAAIDTSTLPSAEKSCQRLSTIARDGAIAATSLGATDDKLQADAVADAKAKDDSAKRRAAVDKLVAELKKLDDDAKPDCVGKDAEVAKAETEMFDAMRVFAALPLSEKAVGKAKFDAARAKVMALKAKLDASLSDADVKFNGIIQNAKGS
jgi:hypothetical protein